MMTTREFVRKLIRNGFTVDWNYEHPDTLDITYDEVNYYAKNIGEIEKTVTLRIPYEDLTIIIECMEDLFKNSESEKEKEKIRRILCPLIDYWGRNAKDENEIESDLYFQEEVDREQEIEDEERSYETDN